MTGLVDVVRAGELERQTWQFRYSSDRHALIIEFYFAEARQTKRHGWRIVEDGYYSRLLNQHESDIKHADVSLPDDVAAEAKQKFLDTLTVGVWQGR